jgi:hypothetical protein
MAPFALTYLVALTECTYKEVGTQGTHLRALFHAVDTLELSCLAA